MNVAVIVPPDPLVSAAEIKARLKISDDDAYLEALATVAQAQIEPTLSWVGTAFGLQTLEARLDGPCWPREIVLDFPPLVQVLSVTYLDADGAEQTLATTAYQVSGIGARRGRVTFTADAREVSLACAPEAIRIRYQAGHAADDPRLAPAKQAVILAVSQLRSVAREDIFLKRETTEGLGTIEWAVSDQATKVVDRAIGALLSVYQVVSA